MGILEFGALLSLILGLTPAAPAEREDLPLQDWTPPTTGYRWGFCVVPEGLGLELDGEENTQNELALVEYRAGETALFGLTPPPPAVRMAADFEPAQTLLLAYPGIEEYDELFSDIIQASWDQGDIEVLVPSDYREHLAALIRERGVPGREVTLITDVPFDTVWMRDYGPQAVITGRSVSFVDGRYFVNCIDDDSVPTRLANRRRNRRGRGGVRVYRPDLWTEGGNLISNGQGLCVTSTYLTTQNGRTEAEVSALTRAYYGCEETVFLEPLTGNVVAHVDMFIYFASADTILLGQYTPAQDPDNYFILESNLARLASLRTRSGRPFTIIRVPMTDRLTTEPEDWEGPLVRSYLNMLAFNGVVLVPVYETDPLIEARAFGIIQRAFPDRTIVPIRADSIAGDHGTVHCISQTVPRV